jgi:predicted transcriptional regulator
VVRDVVGSDSESEKAMGATSRFCARERRARPDVGGIVAEEAIAAGEKSLGVFVCGPLSMQADVGRAVAGEQFKGRRDVYLHMEHFSWA